MGGNTATALIIHLLVGMTACGPARTHAPPPPSPPRRPVVWPSFEANDAPLVGRSNRVVFTSMPDGENDTSMRFWGNRLVVVDGGVVGVFDRRDGALIAMRSWDTRYEDHTVSVPSRSRSRLVIFELSRRQRIGVRVWDVETDTVVFSEPQREGFDELWATIDRTGRYLGQIDTRWGLERFVDEDGVAAADDGDIELSELRVTDLDDGRVVARGAYGDPDDRGMTVAFCADENLLMRRGPRWQLVAIDGLSPIADGLGAVTVGPGGASFLIRRGSNEIELRRATDGRLLASRTSPFEVERSGWTSDGNHIVISGLDGTALLSPETLEERALLPFGVYEIAGPTLIEGLRHELRITDLPSGNVDVLSVDVDWRLSVDGRTFAYDESSGALLSDVVLHDLPTGEEHRLAEAGPRVVRVSNVALCRGALRVEREGGGVENWIADRFGGSAASDDASDECGSAEEDPPDPRRGQTIVAGSTTVHVSYESVSLERGEALREVEIPVELRAAQEAGAAHTPVSFITPSGTVLALTWPGAGALYLLDVGAPDTWRALTLPEGVDTTHAVMREEDILYCQGRALMARALRGEQAVRVATCPEVMSLALSSDGRFVVGRQGSRVHVIRLADDARLMMDGGPTGSMYVVSSDGHFSTREEDLAGLRFLEAGLLESRRLSPAEGSAFLDTDLWSRFFAPETP